MSDKNRRIRELLLYEIKQKQSAASAARKIYDVEGPNAVTASTCQRWFNNFAQNDTNVDDQPRSGRPMCIDLDTLREDIKEDPACITLLLSQEYECSRRTIVRGLHLIFLGRSTNAVDKYLTN